MKRHFLQLAHTYSGKENVGAYYCSEKLDGMRAFWDGGITRGVPCSSVAFANTAKDGRYVSAPIATGLWSRYGKAIQAPAWWLDTLPPYCLDGELYCGRNGFQPLMSTVKDIKPGEGWKSVRYKVFDMPPPHVVFADGEINETNFKKKFVSVTHKHKMPEFPFKGSPQFREVYAWMCKNLVRPATILDVLQQTELPFRTEEAVAEIQEVLEGLTNSGGEGLILRHPTSTWIPSRVRTCLKVKALHDAEGIVTGYTSGRQTELGSKLLGLMGALVLNYNGHRLELSGFADHERCLAGTADGASATSYAMAHPGVDLPGTITNPMFPRGSKVSFRFRELTDSGIPKEARYWRKHLSE